MELRHNVLGRRIAIVGNAGGGKSTLARQLAQLTSISVTQVDHMIWNPGWVRTPEAELRVLHDEVVSRTEWLIEGFGSLDATIFRLKAADTIVFVDLPLRTHYWWAIKHQMKCVFRKREDFVPGCPMLPKTWALLQTIA